MHVISCAWCMLEVFGFLHCVCGLDLVIFVFKKTSAVNLTLKCISNVIYVICYRRLQDIRNEILDLQCFLSVNVVDPQG